MRTGRIVCIARVQNLTRGLFNKILTQCGIGTHQYLHGTVLILLRDLQMVDHTHIIMIDIAFAGPVGSLHMRSADDDRGARALGIGADTGIMEHFLLAGNFLLAAVGKRDTLRE